MGVCPLAHSSGHFETWQDPHVLSECIYCVAMMYGRSYDEVRFVKYQLFSYAEHATYERNIINNWKCGIDAWGNQFT